MRFDIDKFLNSSPSKQSKELQTLIGLDLTEIDAWLKKAYDDRTFKNRTLQEAKAKKLDIPTEVEKPEIDKIGKELQEIKDANEKLHLLRKEVAEKVEQVLIPGLGCINKTL